MERGYSDMFRNSSEEMFLKTMMDSSVGMPAPTMEMLGFKNLSQNFRVDSEELFKSWLTNGESPAFGSGSLGHRPRHLSRRILNEPTALANQPVPEVDVPIDTNHHQLSNAAEKGLQASNLYLAKAWFNSSQPMTRSRSSELRRRYVAMQNSQTFIGMEAAQNPSAQSVMKQEFANPNDFSVLTPNQMQGHFGPSSFTPPSNSSYNDFGSSHIGNIDPVSSLVSMLKGTLESKRAREFDTEAMEGAPGCFHFSQNDVGNQDLSYGQGNHYHEAQDPAGVQTAEGLYDLGMESLISPTNQNQMHTVSQEPCLSESSAAAPVISSGFDACDGPSNSGQTITISNNSRRQARKNTSPENGSSAKDFREQNYGNLKDSKKRGSLVRYGSVTSTVSADRGDPTKKRRVERSRKMAEAKERNSTPAVPSDMQSILKRCENLEKEVRSLKLNLSFMNRKDSEQTKQIEELQVQNEELGEEKERLLEEIERIISDTGRN
uniref:Protein CYCLOPS n=1 Tax=Kalanchoe fedtschenkoi TaxID=63787 RepID=A0A7N0UH00_KALFE